MLIATTKKGEYNLHQDAANSPHAIPTLNFVWITKRNKSGFLKTNIVYYKKLVCSTHYFLAFLLGKTVHIVRLSVFSIKRLDDR